jgi:RNA polymerase sigma-70 factor, ECF subfamily
VHSAIEIVPMFLVLLPYTYRGAVDELAALALAARDGNRMALAQLIRRTQPDVWRCCARLGPLSEADDLTQEVYVRMMRALPSFRGDSLFRTWLLAIARNVATGALRSRHRRDLLQTAPKFLARIKPYEAADTSLGVRELINELEPRRREAFVLTQLIGLSYDEAAAVCSVRVGTIRSRVARARSQLIDAINEVDLRAEQESVDA